jgi:hypothetical protein
MKVGFANPLPRLVRGLRWILVSWAIQFEPCQHNNPPGASLVFQANPFTPAAFDGQEKLLPAISGTKDSVIIHWFSAAEFDRILIRENLWHLDQLIGLGLCQRHDTLTPI